MRKILKVLAGVFLLMSISSCTERVDDHPNDFNEDGTFDHPIDTIVDIENDPKVEYDKDHLLVVFKGRDEISTDDKKKLGILSVDKVPGTRWHSIELDGNHDASSMIKKFRNSDLFELVDYDYIYGKGDEGEGIKDLSVDQRDIFSSIDLSKAYDFMEENGGERGGSKDVIVAVLDTGVDINHLDLRDNIWTNANETDKNGIDDDSNGYVDDIHGWNFVDNSSNVQDDNGHGTHVAGIIGSEKNNFGTTGIAYNCKIMPVKCGSSSGFFNNSWVASAISYAAGNGADIINMSFGGYYAMSLAVEEALKSAYSTSFLVSSAGNDAYQNEQKYLGITTGQSYPASYPYVFGVMSSSVFGYESWFTDFDSIPNDKIEYNVYAPGENYPSTFPNNKYASLSGTSMSSAVISGIAALIRSMHPDKQAYPTKFIASQIQNTSNISVISTIVEDRYEPHKYVNAYNALAKASKPNVRLYDYYTFDDKTISEKNNDNGIIDSGETIQIGMELENIGGKSYKTKATINMDRLSEDVKEPYVSINKDCIEFDEIGVYSIRDSGLKYAEDGMTVIGTSNCFEIQIDDKCPDNYMVAINVVIEWEDEEGRKYSNTDVIYISVTKRILLKSRIDSDVVLPKNTSYILLSTLTITEKGSLTIEEGVDIQMYNDTSTAYYGEIANSPKIVNNGTLNINGVEGNMVKIHSSELYCDYASFIYLFGQKFNCSFLNAENVCFFNTGENPSIIDDSLPLVSIVNSHLEYHTNDINLRKITDYKLEYEDVFLIVLS